jgi:BirA family biotin operon repressor/biotin-[acetyl-CoA-carboxylase] ligase
LSALGTPARLDRLSAEVLVSGLGSRFWEDILCYQSVASTNDIAMSLPLKNDLRSGLVILAETQEKGRGRLGRKWISPPGLNVCMSMLLRPEIEPRHAAFLTIMTALASASALREETGLDVRIKWPNDLMVSGKKLGGILAEIKTEDNCIQKAVIGVGININSSASDFPEEIADIATSVLLETGRYFPRAGIITGILNSFEARYNLLRTGRRGLLIKEMRALSSSLGREVRITDCGVTISGLAEDIDEEGMLLVRLASGHLRRVGSGDLLEPGG